MRIPNEVVTLDFETYWAEDYTLKKMSTTDYIRDPRFKAQCVGIRRHGETKAKWYKHEDIPAALAAIDWPNTSLLCHHAHFDGLILSHHYGHVPGFYLCTLSMARPFHGGEIPNNLEALSLYYGGQGKLKDYLLPTRGIRDLPDELMNKLGEGCAQDVDETWRIYTHMAPHYPPDELVLIHLTVKLYADPILKVNHALAQAVHDSEVKRRKDLVDSVGVSREALRSRPQFAKLLESEGVVVPTKVSPRTGKSTFAFAKNDLEFQALAEHDSARVRDLVEARLLCQSSFEETRAIRLMSHGRDPYRLPLYLAYGKAHTLRWAGGDNMNPQNFGRESKLRNAIEAPEGHVLVIGDSAQIEARANATLANEVSQVEAFRNGADIYKKFAAESIWKIPEDQISKQQRFVGKTAILGLGFYMGAKKYQYTLESGAMGPKVVLEHPDMYGRTVQAYREKYSAIRNQWYYLGNQLRMMVHPDHAERYGPIVFGCRNVLLPNGLYLKYPNLRAKWNEQRQDYTDFVYNENTKIHGGVLNENIIQALARIVVAEQALLVADKWRIVLLVHDEVVLCVPEDKAEEAKADLTHALSTPPGWWPQIPVSCEVEISRFYKK